MSLKANSYQVLAYFGLLVFGIFLGLILAGNGGGNAEESLQNVEKKQEWGCPMDPEVHSDRPGKCPICGMSLSLQTIETGGNLGLQMTESAVKLAEIQTTTLKIQEERIHFPADGMLNIENGKPYIEFWLDLKEMPWFSRTNYFSAESRNVPVGKLLLKMESKVEHRNGPNSRIFVRARFSAGFDLDHNLVQLYRTNLLTVHFFIPLDDCRNWLMLPAHAVLQEGQQTFVYVRDPSSKTPRFMRREVQIAAWDRFGHHCWAESGLVAGEEVVTDAATHIDGATYHSDLPTEIPISIQYESKNEAKPFEQATFPISEDSKYQIRRLFENYFELKNALVQGKAYSAAIAASEMVLFLGEKVSLENPDAAAFWSAESPKIRSEASIISGTKDLAVQRAHFALLSPSIIRLNKAFDLREGYHQFCPMALHNEGAHWLSRDQEIMNPYFGAQMLHCGWVLEGD